MKLRTALFLGFIGLVGGQASVCADGPNTGDPQIDAILSGIDTRINQGEPGTAVQKAQEAAKIAKERYGDHHPIYGTAMYFLGTISIFAEDYGVGQTALKKALEIRSENFGENSIEVADTLKSLGILAMGKNRADESKRYLSKAAGIYEKTPEGRQKLPEIRHLEAVAVSQLEGPPGAEQAWRKVIESLDEQALDNDSDLAMLTVSWNNLGLALTAQGKSSEAIDAYKHGLQVPIPKGNSPVSGQMQLWRSAIYRALGMEYAQIGENDKAREAYDAAWRDADLDSEMGRWLAGSSLSKLATLEIEADELKSAEIHIHRALEIMKGHPREGEAKEAFEDLMETIKKKSGKTSG